MRPPLRGRYCADRGRTATTTMPDFLTGRPGIVITVRCRLASLRYVVVSRHPAVGTLDLGRHGHRHAAIAPDTLGHESNQRNRASLNDAPDCFIIGQVLPQSVRFATLPVPIGAAGDKQMVA